MTKIGVALGGGAVLGSAHIGILRALEEAGIEPDYISGTSIGAFVAALYASGVPIDELESIAIELDWLDMTNFKLSRLGLLGNDKIGKLVLETVGKKLIEETSIPLAIVATDISTGEEIVLRNGLLYKAVMASSCLPGIFIPVEWENHLLVDGFLCENVPVSPLKTMGAEKVIACDLTSNRKFHRPDDVIDVLSNTFDIGFRNMIIRNYDEEVTLLVQPELSSYSRTNTSKTRELIQKGYEAGREAVRNQKKKLTS